METASARAHKQTTVQATIQEAPKAVVSLKTRVRHVLEESSGMDTDGHALVCSKSIHQRSQSTGCVLVRKAPTNRHGQKSAQQVKADCDGASNETMGKVSNVKPTWSGCEVKQVGTCHCCNTTPTVYTRILGRRLSSPTARSLCGGDPPPMTVRRNHFSRPWVQGWKGSQLQAIKPSQLDDYCSANNCLQEGCGRTGRTARRTLNAPTASQ